MIFMAEQRYEYRYATEDELEEMKQKEFSGWMFTYVYYIKYPRVRNRDDPWVTVTRLNPRGRVQGSSELEDPLQPSTSGNCSAAEDLAGVGLVVDLTDFGEEAVVHVEDEPVIGEFHEDPDSDSSGFKVDKQYGLDGVAEENDGEPVDDLALMKRAYTNKKTGQINDGLVREVTTLSVPKKKGRLFGLGRHTRSVSPSSAPPPFVDPEIRTAQLKDKDDRISLLETQMAAQQAGYEAQRRLNQQMMEMMQRMYPNEEINPRNIPRDPRDLFLGIFRGFKFRGNEPSEYTEGHVPRNILRDTFLGIYRGTCSSEFAEGSFPWNFPMKIPRNISSELPR
uniref:Uncharacterized protein n=1 Tax=Brassica oleracea var. oleracea TaxID=109376 RepID=A0A0D3CKE4_BRAOL